MFLVQLLTFLAVTATIVNAWSWNPDPERGEKIRKRWEEVRGVPNTPENKPFLTEKCGQDYFGPDVPPRCAGAGSIYGTPVGRPVDQDQRQCDSYCCHRGSLTGVCDGGVCKCTDDQRDAICGPDGRFLDISCPFDTSACKRKCCREGHTPGNGHCGGFLRIRCRC